MRTACVYLAYALCMPCVHLAYTLCMPLGNQAEVARLKYLACYSNKNDDEFGEDDYKRISYASVKPQANAFA